MGVTRKKKKTHKKKLSTRINPWVFSALYLVEYVTVCLSDGGESTQERLREFPKLRVVLRVVSVADGRQGPARKTTRHTVHP